MRSIVLRSQIMMLSDCKTARLQDRTTLFSAELLPHNLRYILPKYIELYVYDRTLLYLVEVGDFVRKRNDGNLKRLILRVHHCKADAVDADRSLFNREMFRGIWVHIQTYNTMTPPLLSPICMWR